MSEWSKAQVDDAVESLQFLMDNMTSLSAGHSFDFQVFHKRFVLTRKE